MSSSSSPLGRDDQPHPQETALVTVRLINTPLDLLFASRERHDELMREFRLMALSGTIPDGAAPRRLLELVQVLGVQYAGTSARPDQAIDAALERGETTLDLVYAVPPAAAGAAQVLAALMDDADDFCRSQQLLTLARPPSVITFSAWYLQCFVEQVRGDAPRPWSGPLHL